MACTSHILAGLGGMQEAMRLQRQAAEGHAWVEPGRSMRKTWRPAGCSGKVAEGRGGGLAG